jgi:hypothetical protein
MEHDQRLILLDEAKDLVVRKMYYAGCILNEMAAFTTPNTETVPNIARPGETYPNEFVFRHPTLKSHTAERAFEYRREEIAVLKSIYDDMTVHKDQFLQTSHRLLDILHQVENLASAPSHPSTIPQHLDALTPSLIATLSRDQVQALLYLHLPAFPSAPALPASDQDPAYLPALRALHANRLARLRALNRALASIQQRCQQLRHAVTMMLAADAPE